MSFLVMVKNMDSVWDDHASADSIQTKIDAITWNSLYIGSILSKNGKK